MVWLLHASLFLQKIISIFFWRNNEALVVRTDTCASWPLQNKISIFLWRNYEALVVWQDASSPHYVLRKKKVFFWWNKEALFPRPGAGVPQQHFLGKNSRRAPELNQHFFWRIRRPWPLGRKPGSLTLFPWTTGRLLFLGQGHPAGSWPVHHGHPHLHRHLAILCCWEMLWGAPAFVPRKMASLFLQIFFFWGHNLASKPHPAKPPVHHYLFRKKCLFFSEEIMKHAGVSPRNKCFIISSEKNADFFLKK